jgi:aldehyde dehydrogenase
MYGLGAGLGRAMHMKFIRFQELFRLDVWINQYHSYPAGAPLGYKQSGIGRENHKMMLWSLPSDKNMLTTIKEIRVLVDYSL